MAAAPAPSREAGFRSFSPVSEGLAGKRRPNGFFQGMGDRELLEFADARIAEKGYARRTELKSGDPNLYRHLSGRGMLGKLKFSKDRRSWKSLDDEEVLGLAMKKMNRAKIDSSAALQQADNGLYHELWERGLLAKLPFTPRKRRDRDWASMTDGDVAADCQDFISREGIANKRMLQDADIGRYNILYSRGLLAEVRFPKARRCWASKSDSQVLVRARREIAERGLKSKDELREADLGLYLALRQRKLLRQLALDGRRRDWGAGIEAQAGGTPGKKELARRFVEWPEAEERAERERRERAFLSVWRPAAEEIAYETKAPARTEDKLRFAIAGLYSAARKSRSEAGMRAVLRAEVTGAIRERVREERVGWKPYDSGREGAVLQGDCDAASAVRTALCELGGRKRRIVELSFISRKCDEEASKAIGMSVPAFRAAKREAVEAMRKRLSDWL
ncbi:MAG: hypothetical protein AB1324_00095 [Candidatus Micrarchaeota archaeon]